MAPVHEFTAQSSTRQYREAGDAAEGALEAEAEAGVRHPAVAARWRLVFLKHTLPPGRPLRGAPQDGSKHATAPRQYAPPATGDDPFANADDRIKDLLRHPAVRRPKPQKMKLLPIVRNLTYVPRAPGLRSLRECAPKR
jgi:hypothetical protein